MFNPWNLLLIIPFIVLLTPLYNRRHPSSFGMPFFYWFQFAGRPGRRAVHDRSSTVKTQDEPVRPGRRRRSPDVDELDEGSAR